MSAAAKADAKKDRALYIGRRTATDKRPMFAFIRQSDQKEIYFRGIRGLVMGYTYWFDGERMPVDPEMTEDPRQDDPAREAADALVAARDGERRRKAALARDARPALKAAIAALRPLMRGLDYFERRDLIAHLAASTEVDKP